MIDFAVEQVFIDWLTPVVAIPVRHSMESLEPNLVLPAIVVKADLQRRVGREPLYEFKVTVQYKSVSDQIDTAAIQTAMTSIETALETQPSTIASAAAFQFFAIDAFDHANHEVSEERRINARELLVSVQ